MRRYGLVLGMVLGWGTVSEGRAQGPAPTGPPIDTVIVVTENVFGPREARGNFAFRLANGIHVTTQARVVRRELLFRRGEPYDSALVAESERNLRSLGVFRDVRIDSVRVAGKLAVFVRTRDAWSTQLQLGARSTGTVFTWEAGVAETNFLGTATFASVNYRKGVDRRTTALRLNMNRLFDSRVRFAGFYESLSDGKRGGWLIGLPFRAFSDRHAIELSGEAADQRALQFVSRSEVDRDTVEFQRRAFVNRAAAAYAPIAEPGQYLRLGVAAQIRREEFLPWEFTGAVDDTVTGAVGAFAEYRRARFTVVTHFNGFAHQEDLDLSTVVRLATWVAPAAFGYPRSGIGPAFSLSAAAPLPNGFVRWRAAANGLFTRDGLDSGRVWTSLTVGTQFVPRQATFVHLVAGAIERAAPGREFDLGHGIGPRSFSPHAFTGDRTVWGTFEHRVFLFDQLLGLLGLGFAGFVDYGGAWFRDQPARFGGNVGLGLRTGFARASGASVGRVDFAYQFGDGVVRNRWVVSAGRGFLF